MEANWVSKLVKQTFHLAVLSTEITSYSRGKRRDELKSLTERVRVDGQNVCMYGREVGGRGG